MPLRDAITRSLPPIFRIHAEAKPTPDHQEAFTIRPIIYRYLRSRLETSGGFDSVRYYTFFVGWPRSGHSLFGALLDAHPSVVIAHELDALPLIEAGFSRDQLFSCITRNARSFGLSSAGRGWSDYSYAVPGQWQGRYEDLRVIGDKKGGMSMHHIAHINPNVIDKVRTCVRVPLRVIVYHRNPFDILGTVARRAGETTMRGSTVAHAFHNLVPAVERVRAQLHPDELIEVYHEDFVAEPAAALTRVLDAYGESASESYLAAATAIVNRSPSQSRSKVSWPAEVRRMVETEIDRHEYLRRYSFE